jgi:hypothetical protein
MAFQTLVTSPSLLARQVVSFLEEMSQRKGTFVLAMLVPSETGLSDKWNLVLSAPWIDRGGLVATIPTITSVLLNHLSTANAHKLERISVLPTNDRLVALMADMRIPFGKVYLVQSFPQAEGALVLLAEPLGTSKSNRAQPVHPREYDPPLGIG